MPRLSPPSALTHIAPRLPGFGLGREFYASPAVFAAEMEAVFARAWMFAGHVCELQRQGDWFTVEIGSAPLTPPLSPLKGGEGAYKGGEGLG
ncbi:MAG: hypothetical protein ACT4N4_03085, partial [Rhodospirillales bacterium]